MFGMASGACGIAPALGMLGCLALGRRGGMVALRVVGGRLRFDIDAAAARKAGLRISSQLLRLALSVRGGLS